MNNEETYTTTKHVSHTYNNIEFTKGPHYLRLLQLLNETMQPNPVETSTSYLNLYKEHFDAQADKDTFTNVYGTEIYFLIDPLLNDIDDIIAFLYFFYLTISYIKAFKPTDTITLNIILENIDLDKTTTFNKVLDVTTILINTCNKILETLNITTILINLVTLKETQTYPPIEKPTFEKTIEHMLIAVSGEIKSDIITLERDKESPPAQESNTLSLSNTTSYQPIHKTFFILRGILNDTEDLIKFINDLAPSDTNRINIIANGTDIFSHEDGSCPSNVRCGTKIKGYGLPRDIVFNKYTEFIKGIQQNNNIIFNCFPLKRVDRPFTVQFVNDYKGETSIHEPQTIVSTNGESDSTELAKVLTLIRSTLKNIKMVPSNTYKSAAEVINDQFTFADICFPYINNKIGGGDTTNKIIQSCEAYKQYGSFLIDMITVMSNPTKKTLHTRTLIMFKETLVLESFDTMEKIDKYFDDEVTIKLGPNDESLLSRLYEHSNNALKECYNWNSATNKQFKSVHEFNLNLEQNKLKLYSDFLSKTPGTLESLNRMIGGSKAPTTIELINPKNALLSSAVKKAKDDKNVPKICDKTFCIIQDLALIFTGMSSGPNGVLVDCDNQSTYGKYRMNTFYKNEELTKKLIVDFITFRNANKKYIFENLYVVKLLDRIDKVEDNYRNTIQFLYDFYMWCISQKLSLGQIGINLKSRCQTWLRRIPNHDYGKKGIELVAHNTIPVPHFQTVVFINDEEKFLENVDTYIKHNEKATIKVTDDFKRKYIDLMYYLTRSMRDGYGTTYPIKITYEGNKLYTEPDYKYNGNAFIDLDYFYNYLISKKPPTSILNRFRPTLNRFRSTKKTTNQNMSNINICTYNVLATTLLGYNSFRSQDPFQQVQPDGKMNKEYIIFNEIRLTKIIEKITELIHQRYIITLQEVDPYILNALELIFKTYNYKYAYCSTGEAIITNFMGLLIASPYDINEVTIYNPNKIKDTETYYRPYYIKKDIQSFKYYKFINEEKLINNPSVTRTPDHLFYTPNGRNISNELFINGEKTSINENAFKLGNNLVIVCSTNGISVMTSHFPANNDLTAEHTQKVNTYIKNHKKIIFTCDSNEELKKIKMDNMQLLNDPNIFTIYSDGFYIVPGRKPLIHKYMTPPKTLSKSIDGIWIQSKSFKLISVDVDKKYDTLKETNYKPIDDFTSLYLDKTKPYNSTDNKNIHLIFTDYELKSIEIETHENLSDTDRIKIYDYIGGAYHYDIEELKKKIDKIQEVIGAGIRPINSFTDETIIKLINQIEQNPKSIDYQDFHYNYYKMQYIYLLTIINDFNSKFSLKNIYEIIKKYIRFPGPNLMNQPSDHLCVMATITQKAENASTRNNRANALEEKIQSEKDERNRQQIVESYVISKGIGTKIGGAIKTKKRKNNKSSKRRIKKSR